MWCGAVRCGAVRCGAVWCGAVRCGVVWCADLVDDALGPRGLHHHGVDACKAIKSIAFGVIRPPGYAVTR